MKKTIVMAALMLEFAVAAQAGAINPTQEVNYRTNGNNPTGWSFVKVADATNNQFEVKHSARIFAVQTWEIPNINDVTELNFYYTRVSGQTNQGDLCIWAFPYNVLTTTDFSTEDGSFLDNVKTVFGAYPGNDITNQPLAKSTAGVDSLANYARVVTLDADGINALKDAGTITGGTLKVNILISTLKSENDLNFKYYSVGASEKKPYLVVSVSTAASVVSNITTGIDYPTLSAAVSAAAANDVLQVNEDITVGERIGTTVPLTIQGKTGAEVITCTTNATTMLFLPGENAPLTLKNLVLDGNSTARTNCAIEASKTLLTMEGVTVQHFDRSASGQKQGFICIKTKGSVILDGCTFKDNKVAAGYGDVFVGLNNSLTLKGCNTVGNGIYVEKKLYFNDGEATHKSPITVIADSGRESSAGLGSSNPFIKGTTDTYKYTLSGNASWVIAGNESQNYIYVTRAASVTKSSDKAMSAGTGYKLGTVTIE